MELNFKQTGDPWHDWGLCELYEALQDPSLQDAIHLKVLGDYGFSAAADLSESDFAAQVGAVLASNERWNGLYPRFEECRKLERCYPRVVNGRRVPDEKYEPKVDRTEWRAAGLHGNPPQTARNRCQRLASIPLTQGQLRTLMDPGATAGSFHCLLEDVVAGKPAEITQGANPLVAKHHSNQKVRGPSFRNSPLGATAAALLTGYCASVSRWKPFAKEDTCAIFLPENLSFTRMRRLWRHLKHAALVDPDSPNGHWRTNLPLRADGDAARLLILLDALQDCLALHSEAEDDLFGAGTTEVNDWLVIHFSSGTNVNVGTITRIEVPGAVFPLLTSVDPPERMTERTSVSFVRDCLVHIRLKDLPIQDKIAAALLAVSPNPADAWRGLMRCAFLLYKNVDRAEMTNRTAAFLLSHFYQNFARGLLTMTEAEMNSCRKLGEIAGRAFYQDVTILSRLHNSTSPADLRTNLELVAFRLFKLAAADKAAGLWHISAEEFQTVLDLCREDRDWQSAANTISAFASLRAFNENLGEGNK